MIGFTILILQILQPNLKPHQTKANSISKSSQTYSEHESLNRFKFLELWQSILCVSALCIVHKTQCAMSTECAMPMVIYTVKKFCVCRVHCVHRDLHPMHRAGNSPQSRLLKPCFRSSTLELAQCHLLVSK